MTPLTNICYFLIHTLADSYLFILILRLIFQHQRVDYYHPFSQLIAKATQPIISPLRRLIPNYKGFDLATFTTLFALSGLKVTLMAVLMATIPPSLLTLILWSLANLALLTVKLLFFAVLIRALLSWLSSSHSLLKEILYALTEPLLRRARRTLPLFNGFDLSPLAVLIGLQLITILISGYVPGWI